MSSLPVPEAAVAAGEDPRQYARVLAAVYDATMAGDKTPARPRHVVGESWQRLMSAGIDPERQPPGPQPIDGADLEEARRESGLWSVLNELGRGLESVTDTGENIVVVADRHGRVLWRSGAPSVLGRADGLGFVEGANWAESSAGTNAIGTALISRRAVQIFSAEHYLRSHHPWTCAGAPIRDPRTGHVLGAVDVSGPARSVHPTTVALVDAVARLAESQLRETHRQSLDLLRAVAAPLMARHGGPALAVDKQGWVAAVESVPARSRILVSDASAAGQLWIPDLGLCEMEPMPGGWLVRPIAAADPATSIPTQVTLDFRDPSRPRVTVWGQSGEWAYHPTPRHADILHLLARHREGRSAPQMADSLFGDSGRALTVRAEMSRLRKHLGPLLRGQPYRFADGVAVFLHD